MAPTRRNDPTYVRRAHALKRRARRNDAPCHLCGHRIDYALPYTHPMSFTADHLEAVGAGGHMHGELAPAHRSCNSRRGKKHLHELKAAREPRHSQQW